MASAEFAGRSDDPEEIHGLRFAIRGMRAALSILRTTAPVDHRLWIEAEMRTLQSHGKSPAR
jgi:CHAD domain-containing protein